VHSGPCLAVVEKADVEVVVVEVYAVITSWRSSWRRPTAEVVVMEVVATQLVEEEDMEVKVVAVTTQLVEEEDAKVEVVTVAMQLVEEEDVELVEADAVVIAEMEADT
jgi:hypothetical protein